MNIQYEKYTKHYEKTAKGKFIRQRANAKRRGIDWELSFEEWWRIWEKSGKWEQRGVTSDSYVMSRILDHGPYKVGNVVIRTMKENSQEGLFHKIISL